jgi:pyruvate dehydrogenase E1 component alpha subunit/2-oxoisovalerate dehydrogenase E1 component alpha subunit
VLLLANNQYAYSTPTDRQFACRSLVDKAIGYGVAGNTVDGTDLRACLEVIGQAVERARHGEGPQLIVANLLRLCGHGEHDDASYVDGKLKGSALGRDCLKLSEEYLLEQDWADNNALAGWRDEAVQSIEEVVAKVQRESPPDPYKEEWCALASKHLSEGHENA